MTLRFIVDRMLRALIELAEHDADAELVDALHDALDVATPRRRRTEGVIETRGPGPGLRRLATVRRAERQVGRAGIAIARSEGLWPCRWGRTSSGCER